MPPVLSLAPRLSADSVSVGHSVEARSKKRAEQDCGVHTWQNRYQQPNAIRVLKRLIMSDGEATNNLCFPDVRKRVT